MCIQEAQDTCPAGGNGDAAQFFCGANDSSNKCFANEARSHCALNPLSPTCALVTPLANGNCIVPANLASSFSGANPDSAAQIGIEYGASSICLPVASGSLQLASGTGYPGLDTTCIRSECDNGELSILIKRQVGSGYQRFACPEGQTIDLGISDGFQPGVRRMPYSLCTRSITVNPLPTAIVFGARVKVCKPRVSSLRSEFCCDVAV